ncbi:hypothetical protein BC827DRAFT_1231418 [Russula dissimulans]|nr:hypothetical protein BC827DRAFT_1231418 [Russula dissimulans]
MPRLCRRRTILWAGALTFVTAYYITVLLCYVYKDCSVVSLTSVIASRARLLSIAYLTYGCLSWTIYLK